MPLLKGGTIPDRPLYRHYPHYSNQGGTPVSIIMEDGWKLICYQTEDRCALYHLAKDPGERKDLAAADPARTKAMKAKLDSWLKATGAKLAPKRRRASTPELIEKQRVNRHKWLAKIKKRQEERAASYLREDFEPNRDWWGSED